MIFFLALLFIDLDGLVDQTAVMVEALLVFRWLFVALAFVVLGALYAEALGLLRLEQEDTTQLLADLAEVRADRERLAQMMWRERDRRRPEIVVLPPRRAPRVIR